MSVTEPLEWPPHVVCGHLVIKSSSCLIMMIQNLGHRPGHIMENLYLIETQENVKKAKFGQDRHDRPSQKYSTSNLGHNDIDPSMKLQRIERKQQQEQSNVRIASCFYLSYHLFYCIEFRFLCIMQFYVS